MYHRLLALIFVHDLALTGSFTIGYEHFLGKEASILPTLKSVPNIFQTIAKCRTFFLDNYCRA